jgi:hypothetical protein
VKRMEAERMEVVAGMAAHTAMLVEDTLEDTLEEVECRDCNRTVRTSKTLSSRKLWADLHS